MPTPAGRPYRVRCFGSGRLGEEAFPTFGGSGPAGLSARGAAFSSRQASGTHVALCTSGGAAAAIQSLLRLHRVLEVTRLNDRAGLHDNLILGRRELSARFSNSPPGTLRAGESLVAAARSRDVIYRLQDGWACQFRDVSDGRRAIIDIYLPGDVIGLDAVLRTRPLEEVMALTSITVQAIDVEGALTDLMAQRATALYIAWLLCQRQRRADRLLAAISSLDARGRLAMMVLDFYKRLHTKRLITSMIYNLPLTQDQIGRYLGLTIVHVNRVLRSLRDELIVNLEKHCVTILNLEQLTRLAQDREIIGPAPGIGERP